MSETVGKPRQTAEAREGFDAGQDEDVCERPTSADVRAVAELHGAMRGSVHVPPGVDLTEPSGETWEAESLP